MPKKPYLKCYFGCKTKGPYHRFPKPEYPNMDRFISWKTVLAPAVQDKGDSFIYNNVRICDSHFEDRYRLPSRRLTGTGVPTLNIQRPREKRAMSTPTALNSPPYEGVVERRAVPVELDKASDGRPVARVGTCVPIHTTPAEEAARLALTTHHYAGLFIEKVLPPLGELAYVRLDADTAEKVFVNRTRRILITSADGRLAQWRAVPTFESRNRYVAGTPVVDGGGALVSAVLARRHNHYALAVNDGEGGYFDTTESWLVLDPPPGALIYADRWFTTREELREYVSNLGPAGEGAPRPVLHRGASPRVSLVAPGGRQIAHVHIYTALTDDVEYL